MEQLGKGLKASSASIIVLLRKNNQCMRKAVVSHSSSRWESGFSFIEPLGEWLSDATAFATEAWRPPFPRLDGAIRPRRCDPNRPPAL
jgi:hypothetical protein